VKLFLVLCVIYKVNWEDYEKEVTFLFCYDVVGFVGESDGLSFG